MRDGEWQSRRTVHSSIRLFGAVWTVALGLVAVWGDVMAQPSCPRVEVTLVEQSASTETRSVELGDQTIFVKRNSITTTSDISEMKVSGDDVETLILIKYKPAAAARLLDATTDHDGLRLAFVVDDDIWLAVTWQGRYGIGPEGMQLSFTRPRAAQAQRLMESVRGCIAEIGSPLSP
jgi:hypothetical protein